MRIRGSALLLSFCLTASLSGQHAHAEPEKKLNRPLASWMVLDDAMKRRLPSLHAEAPHLNLTRLTTMAHDTSVPVITPHDTLNLIAEIYESEKRAQTAQSALEQAYSQRVALPLKQIGYDLFRAPGIGDLTLPASALQPTPDRPARHKQKLNRTSDSESDTHIIVIGHVNGPGRQKLADTHTITDALTQAGGIKKSGSLRQVKLIRNGHSTLIDLYPLLQGKDSKQTEMTLRAGDRLVVPPVGATMAVTGPVKHPGIYELPPVNTSKRRRHSDRAIFEDIMTIAGLTSVRKPDRFIKLTPAPNGQEKIETMPLATASPLTDGNIVMIETHEVAEAPATTPPDDYADTALDVIRTAPESAPAATSPARQDKAAALVPHLRTDLIIPSRHTGTIRSF